MLSDRIHLTIEEIDMLTPRELKKFAQRHEIDPQGLSKTELIRSIQRKEGNFDCFGSTPVAVCDQHQCLWRDDCRELATA